MRKLLKFSFALLLFIFSCFACAQAEEELAVNFRLKDTEGNEAVLGEYLYSRPVILLFWTTWCPFCARELRALNNLSGELSEKGFKIFAIDVGESASKVRRFLSGYSLSLDVLLDQDSRVAVSYGVMGVPTFIVINPYGEIVFAGNYFDPEKFCAEAFE